ncbi:Mov34/MPN/PAD-1 family protein [Sorangium sp. So ce381]|uniref:Mov34/MPN/PAD-1 family protein n=1 Tax=Sorangium sp. So ce381 TaxID=3133307 RepID=UPI003F5B5EAE
MSSELTARLRFLRRDGSTLVVSAPALAAMVAFQQRTRRDAEAGGVLLGRYLRDAPHVIVDEVTTPMPGDRRWFTGFHRSRRAHQRVIDDRWKASRGTCQYLGEWHTHPEETPTPSWIDRCDWRRRLARDSYDAASLFFLIVGTRAVAAWEGTRAEVLTQLPEHPNDL